MESPLYSGRLRPIRPTVGHFVGTKTRKERLDLKVRAVGLLEHRRVQSNTDKRDGAYWGIGTPIARYQVKDSLPVPPEVTERLAKVRTRLNPFTDAEQCCLINWGYAICDAAIRKYGQPTSILPPSWPYPAYALDGAAPRAVTPTDTTDVVPSELNLALKADSRGG